MSNVFVKDPYIKVLLDRRDEIKAEINKLQAEYKAIGELILRDHHNQEIIKKGEER